MSASDEVILKKNLENSNNARDYSLSLIRVFGMVLIILCHLCSWMGASAPSQIFNVGVFLFLFLSGYLYSRKEIKQPHKWLAKRWVKLCVPVILWDACVILYGIICLGSYPSGMNVAVLLLNLQGIPWIITSIPTIGSGGEVLAALGHLWFVTVILFCYLVLVIVRKCEKTIQRHIHLISLIVLIVSVMLSFLTVNLIYFVCFLAGYVLGKTNENRTFKMLLMITVLMIFGVLLRLLSKRIIDGTELYDIWIVGISHTILAIWLFVVVSVLSKRVTIIRLFAKSKIVGCFDRISYFVYITHYFFLSSLFDLNSFRIPLFAKVVLFCAVSMATAMCLSVLSNGLISIIKDKRTVKE